MATSRWFPSRCLQQSTIYAAQRLIDQMTLTLTRYAFLIDKGAVGGFQMQMTPKPPAETDLMTVPRTESQQQSLPFATLR